MIFSWDLGFTLNNTSITMMLWDSPYFNTSVTLSILANLRISQSSWEICSMEGPTACGGLDWHLRFFFRMVRAWIRQHKGVLDGESNSFVWCVFSCTKWCGVQSYRGKPVQRYKTLKSKWRYDAQGCVYDVSHKETLVCLEIPILFVRRWSGSNTQAPVKWCLSSSVWRIVKHRKIETSISLCFV